MTEYTTSSHKAQEPVPYDRQPTLLLGLGGYGSLVVDHIYEQVKDRSEVSAFSVDTDAYAPQSLQNIPREHILSIAQDFPVSEGMLMIPDAQNWFPAHKLLLYKTLSEGAGQVRAVARLLYELSLRQNRFAPLLAEAARLAKLCVEQNCRMRISVTTSLVGGTGSGIFMQLALLLRGHLRGLFPTLNVKIHGEFVLPANFLYIFSNADVEKRNMEANAYAALKELNAVNQHFFSNGEPVDLYCSPTQTGVEDLPYDYCYLYDRVNLENCFNGKYVEEAILERLFTPSANILNEAFVNRLRFGAKKRGSNLYAAVAAEKLPPDATILHSDLFRAIVNRTSAQSGKQIFFVSSPKALKIDKAQFPSDTELIVHTDPALSEITVVDYRFCLELAQIEKLRFGSGQYYTSYHALVNRFPAIISPHLNKNWHLELANIGEAAKELPSSPELPVQKADSDRFVFISYSSRDFEIANQLKHVLETNGVSCWMAPQSIPAGSDYANEIPKAIGASKAFLLLLSDSSQKSQWVPKEVSIAISKGIVVVPFQIDNAAINEAFNFYLTNSQRISAYNRMTDAYQELLARLKNLMN